MRKFTLLLWGVIFYAIPQINAQETGLFGSLFSQMDSLERDEFLSNLDSLLSGNFTDDDGNLIIGSLGDSLTSTGVVDSLNIMMGDTNQIANLDSLMNQWSEGHDSLTTLFASDGLDSLSRDTLLGQFDFTNGVWNTNVDSLGGIFTDYQDSLNLGNGISTDGLPSPGIGNIFNDLNGSLDSTATTGLGGFEDVINDLFSSALFTNLEIAYGRKEANVEYYGQTYQTGLEATQLVRVGSVPSFDKLWESRWHAMASWTPEEFLTGGGDPTLTNINKDGFAPFVLEFEFASMYNPGFSFGSTAGARVITSLGMEFATYAPAHIDASKPHSLDNVGYTTGFGPQIGTGFATRFGKLTSYATGTFALGRVNGADAYAYRSMKFEAGTRFGDAINVRYSVGQQDWALDANKRVNTRQQFTIGLLTDSLFK